jgi:hypothetical protein
MDCAGKRVAPGMSRPEKPWLYYHSIVIYGDLMWLSEIQKRMGAFTHMF